MTDTIKRHSPYGGILHEVVEHAGTLYFGGIVSEDLSLDAAGQAADVLNQLKVLLDANGSDLSRVLMATSYVTDLADRPGINAVWKRFFADTDLPARATIGVADLGPGVKLELVVTAAKAP